MYVLILIVGTLLLLLPTTTASYHSGDFDNCQKPEPVIDEKPEPLTIPDMIRKEARLAGHDPEVMVRIAEAESTFRPAARNPDSSATGVFQIIIGTWNWLDCTGERTNAKDNIKCAMAIADDGLHHWEESKHGPNGWAN